MLDEATELVVDSRDRSMAKVKLNDSALPLGAFCPFETNLLLCDFEVSNTVESIVKISSTTLV